MKIEIERIKDIIFAVGCLSAITAISAIPLYILLPQNTANIVFAYSTLSVLACIAIYIIVVIFEPE